MPVASPLPDMLQQLQRAGIETRADQASRVLYSTDASIYQIEPLAVVLPRHHNEVAAVLTLATQYQVPVTARGAGSSLAGQAIGAGLIIDCSRYLNRIEAIQLPEPGQPAWVEVEPGAVLETLNRQASRYQLQFGPDPASAERATIGGSLANNATGAHSIQYGMFADHVLQVEVVLADGSLASFAELPVTELPPAGISQRAAALYQAAFDLRSHHAERIRTGWPRLWRRASGYNLNYLLPWSPAAPPRWDLGPAYPPVQPGHTNLATLLAGSEGTLGIVTRARLRLVQKPPHTVLAVLAYDSIASACDDTPRLLELAPSAVELLPRQLIELARAVPAYARLIDFLPSGRDEIPPALLVVEFSGQDPGHLIAQLRQVGPGAYQAITVPAQARIWAVRKVGLGLLMSAPGDAKPLGFMEDIAVPVEQLGDFVRQIDALTGEFGVTAAYYAHASAGCLHIRPVLDLKTGVGVTTLRQLAAAAMQAGLRLGGVPSGEHGDGLARSEWLPQALGDELMQFHRQIKLAADPDNLLNPGKIIDPVPMDQNLRYGPQYRARGWQPVFSFRNQVSLLGAIEMCNGAGVCRKDGGVMCPSFQATREEMHATRGRANLLRAFLSNHLPAENALRGGQPFNSLTLDAV
ncbi:MAG: FAD-binding oxidoreductase, partial [Anaerolineales bacterium]|nr:FAD-binding oxidoreductase [Anaerolineales bacterium]